MMVVLVRLDLVPLIHRRDGRARNHRLHPVTGNLHVNALIPDILAVRSGWLDVF